jgi:hypothetical protein
MFPPSFGPLLDERRELGSMPVGSYVTMQLVDGGNGMLFSMGGGDQVSRSARSSTAAKPTAPTAGPKRPARRGLGSRLTALGHLRAISYR